LARQIRWQRKGVCHEAHYRDGHGCGDPLLFRRSSPADDFDKRAKTEAFEVMAALVKEGRVWWQETGADGAYLFHFYVDQEVPERIRRHSHDPKEVRRFLVPSGRIWACGAEYAARNPEAGHEDTPSGGLGKFPHMGGRFELPAGEYALTTWRTDWPDEALEQERKRLGQTPGKSHDRLGVISGILFVATLFGTLFIAFKTLTAC
jgi:hypothetical protein